jgi:hypothetical protein
MASVGALILALKGRVDAGKKDSWMCFCPEHDDSVRSLHISVVSETLSVVGGHPGQSVSRRKILWRDHGGCSQETILGWLKGHGYYPLQLDDTTLATFGVPATPAEELAFAAQAAPNEPPLPRLQGAWQLAMKHKYSGLLPGELLGVIYRLTDGKSKKFLPCFFDGERWRWQHPAPRPLYGLEKLGARPAAPVLLVEGEKVADAAQERFQDFAVLSVNGGLNAFSRNDLKPLRGKHVTVWMDADTNWEVNVVTWLNLLEQRGVRNPRFVQLPLELVASHPKWDLWDPLPSYLDDATLRKLLEAAVTLEQREVESLATRLTTLDDVFKTFWLVGQHYRVPGKRTRIDIQDFNNMYTRLLTGRQLSPHKEYLRSPLTKNHICSGTVWEPSKAQTFYEPATGFTVWNEYVPPALSPFEGNVLPFLELVNALFYQEDAVEFLCRAAFLVQCLGERAISIFFAVGAQGIGKTMLYNSLIDMVGSHNYYPLSTYDLLGNWNEAIFKVRLMIWNEATGGSRREKYIVYKNLKDSTTDEIIAKRERYVNSVPAKLHGQTFGAANGPKGIVMIVPIEEHASERRLYIATCKLTSPLPPIFYEDYMAWKSLPESNPALYYFLLHYPWQMMGFKPHAPARLTEAKKMFLESSYSLDERDMRRLSKEELEPFAQPVQFLNSFTQHCLQMGLFTFTGNAKFASRSLLQILDKLGIVHTTRKCNFPREKGIQRLPQYIICFRAEGSQGEASEASLADFVKKCSDVTLTNLAEESEKAGTSGTSGELDT